MTVLALGKGAYRRLFRHRLFTAVNVAGLALAFVSCFLVALYIGDELGYDRQHPAWERLYRVSSVNPSNPANANAATVPLVGPLLLEDFADVAASARLATRMSLLRTGSVAFSEPALRFVDPGFLQLFAFEWLAGEPATALTDPASIVLTASLARKYFGAEDSLGRELVLENTVPLRVTGIVRDLPHDTHLTASAFVPLQQLERVGGPGLLDNWSRTDFHTYLQLRDGADPAALQAQLPAFIERHYAAGASNSLGLLMMRVRDIHLRSVLPFELNPPGNVTRLYVFAAAAVCIVVIAGINFVNLTLATAMARGVELGVRRVVGAHSRQLLVQLLSETLLVAIPAALLALMLTELALPLFNALTGKQLDSAASSWKLLAINIVGVVVVAVAAGLYPAFYQAAIKPAKLLRGRLARGRQGQLFRDCIIVVQFASAIGLMASAAVVYRQVSFAIGADAGLAAEGMLILRGSPTEGVFEAKELLAARLGDVPGVAAVTASNQVPYETNGNTIAVWAEGDPNGRNLPFMLVDYGFFATYAIPLAAGRYLSSDFAADALVLPDAEHETTPGNVMLNRSAAAQYGWTPESALGRSFQIYHAGKLTSGEVVGVVEDSRFESARDVVKPMIFIVPTVAIWKGIPAYTALSVKLVEQAPAQVRATIDAVIARWAEVLPEYPAQWHLLEDARAAQYAGERRLGNVLAAFTFTALFVAALGLFALAAFNTAARTREIGVRKVMGGSVWSIVLLLTNDFSKLVLISNVIAWPVAYVAMQRWLETFAYRVDLTPLIFIGSGAIALCIAWVTVGGTAAKAAVAKPVLALRYE